MRSLRPAASLARFFLKPPVMISTHLALLVLCQFRKQRHVLARHLLAGVKPEVLCKAPAWAPDVRALRVAERQDAAMRSLGVHTIPVWQLPPTLQRAIPPPLALFVRGDPDLLHEKGLAIVGSRHASADTAAWAYRRAVAAATARVLVISGGAQGIDAASHRGALFARGRTLAYLGTAVDRIYPSANAELFQSMLQAGGALVSEHPPLARTFRGDWSLRNRLIAAQATGVIVVEAAAISGSLNTADWARRMAVPVYVPPAYVGGERSGVEKLLADGHATCEVASEG